MYFYLPVLFLFNIDFIISTALHEQALKTGQLPADLNTLIDNMESSNFKENHETVVNGENETANVLRDVEEQGNKKSTPMEQVLKSLLYGF